jgi:hypothetical protein
LVSVVALVAFWGSTGQTVAAIVWTVAANPAGTLHVDSLVATPTGFAVLEGPGEGGVTLWTSANGLEWSGRTISGSPNRLVVSGADLLAFAGRWVIRLGPTVDGTNEVARVDFPQLVRVGYGSGRAGLAEGQAGMVAQAFSGDVFWAARGGPFERVIASPDWGEATGMPTGSACDPPTVSSVDVPPMVTTAEGFVTLISDDGADPFGIWPVCEPEVWRSVDGRVWERPTRGSPFGQGAYIYDLAHRNGRLVAVGGSGIDEPALWVSDDGRSWKPAGRLPSERDYELREVAAGELGWVVLGENSDQPGLVGWVSTDADCWTPIPEHVSGRQAAVGSDRFVLADRRTFPVIWVGLSTGGPRFDC